MKRKHVILTVAFVFAIAWILGFLRFESEVALVMYKVLMFPFGYLYLLTESYSQTVPAPRILQNEFIQIALFLVFIMLQAILYVTFIKMLRRPAN